MQTWFVRGKLREARDDALRKSTRSEVVVIHIHVVKDIIHERTGRKNCQVTQRRVNYSFISAHSSILAIRVPFVHVGGSRPSTCLLRRKRDLFVTIYHPDWKLSWIWTVHDITLIIARLKSFRVVSKNPKMTCWRDTRSRKGYQGTKNSKQ